MDSYIRILKHTTLFSGVGENEISAMLDCLQAKKQHYKKDQYIFRQGEYIDKLSVLVEGSLHIQRDDYWGNHSIIHMVKIGEMFGESYLAPNSGALPNDVVATKDSTVIFF